jgi:hypothetical protein
MLCRKRISFSSRCNTRVSNDSRQGYCPYHWHRYQSGLDFHDPSQDFDYEDPILYEFLNSTDRIHIPEVPEIIRDLPNRLSIPRRDSFDINDIDYSFLFETKSQTKSQTESQSKEDLRKFSQDKENVHTKKIVDITLERAKEMIELYKKKKGSEDAYFNLISDHKLSDKAKENMSNFYFSSDSIYNLQTHSFKLVLEGLWIYIESKTNKIKEEMKERLRQELEDNIGTCAQGNLSRLANVLNFYDAKSVEYEAPLPDIMSQISKEKNVSIRKNKALEVLKKRNVPKEDFDAWMEAIEL